MHITEKLINEGYKTYRFIIKNNWNKEGKKQAENLLQKNKDRVIFQTGNIDSDESAFYIPCIFNPIFLTANFNCMEPGGSSVFFVKDGDFEKHFIFGLFEFGKPPKMIVSAY